MRLIFLDTETTGLDLENHVVWEVGAIVRDPMPEGIEKHMPDVEYHWFLPVGNLQRADPFALNIGKFWERHPMALHHLGHKEDGWAGVCGLSEFAHDFWLLSKEAFFVGACVDFDAYRIARIIKAETSLFPMWNYHLVDVENLLAGKLNIPPPWKWRDTLQTVGIDMDKYEQHTALGDARLARDVYDWVMAPQEEVPLDDARTTGFYRTTEVGRLEQEAKQNDH